MTRVERFMFVAMLGCALAFGVFVAVADAEGVLWLASPVLFVVMMVMAGISAWGWRQEHGRAQPHTAHVPLELVLGGVLHLLLLIVTLALVLTGKDGLGGRCDDRASAGKAVA